MPCSVGAVFTVEDAGEVNLPPADPPPLDVKRGLSEDEKKPSFDLGRMPERTAFGCELTTSFEVKRFVAVVSVYVVSIVAM